MGVVLEFKESTPPSKGIEAALPSSQKGSVTKRGNLTDDEDLGQSHSRLSSADKPTTFALDAQGQARLPSPLLQLGCHSVTTYGPTRNHGAVVLDLGQSTRIPSNPDPDASLHIRSRRTGELFEHDDPDVANVQDDQLPYEASPHIATQGIGPSEHHERILEAGHDSPRFQGYRATIEYVADRWRALADKRQSSTHSTQPDHPTPIQDPNIAPAYVAVEARKAFQPNIDVGSETNLRPSVDFAIPFRAAGNLPIMYQEVPGAPDVSSVLEQGLPTGFELPVDVSEAPFAIVDLELQFTRLHLRATRAREIFIVSKAFNIWANQTARRLEREAVARRHMLRFRCFGGWSLTPSSQTLAVYNLRLCSAVQKLRRAINERTSEFEMISSTIQYQHTIALLGKLLDQWCLCLRSRDLNARIRGRERKQMLNLWAKSTLHHAVLQRTLVVQKQQQDRAGLLYKWAREQQRDDLKCNIVQQVGCHFPLLKHVQNWWDQSEPYCYAEWHRRHVARRKLLSTFDQWNLQTRAQAFIWQKCYQSTLRVCSTWQQSMQVQEDLRSIATFIFTARARLATLQCMGCCNQQSSVLQAMSTNARLFVSTTRGFRALEQSKRRKEQQAKDAVRRLLLELRVKSSASRYRRNFFKAMDAWISQSSASATTLSTISFEFRTTECVAICNSWQLQMEKLEQQEFTTRVIYYWPCVEAWQDNAALDERQERQVWARWKSGEQRRRVKDWSISSLHNGGQHHAATTVRRRYEYESRSYALRYWQHTSQGEGHREARQSDLESNYLGRNVLSIARNWGFEPLSQSRRSLETPAGYKGMARGVRDTPTRVRVRTMSVLAEPSNQSMPSIEESDTLVGTSSQETTLPVRSLGPRWRPASPMHLSTTTPRAPVPRHLAHPGRSVGGPAVLGRSTQTSTTTPQRLEPNLSRDIGTTHNLLPLVGLSPGKTPTTRRLWNRSKVNTSSCLVSETEPGEGDDEQFRPNPP